MMLRRRRRGRRRRRIRRRRRRRRLTPDVHPDRGLEPAGPAGVQPAVPLRDILQEERGGEVILLLRVHPEQVQCTSCASPVFTLSEYSVHPEQVQ
jgi:hypothetical protein